jgi:hypothetical protein
MKSTLLAKKLSLLLVALGAACGGQFDDSTGEPINGNDVVDSSSFAKDDSNAPFPSRLANLPAAGWRRTVNQSNLVISTQRVPGLALDAVQIVTTFGAGIDTVFAVLMNQDRGCEWLPTCAENRVIERVSRSEQVVYHRTTKPGFLVSPRDLIARSRVRITPAKGRIEIAAEDIASHPRAPTRPSGVVRVRDIELRTILEKVGPNRTRFTQQALLDPAGSLPAFLVNALATNAPRETAESLARKVKETSYRADVLALRARWPELATFVNAPQ